MKTDTTTQSDHETLTALNRDYMQRCSRAMYDALRSFWPTIFCAQTRMARSSIGLSC